MKPLSTRVAQRLLALFFLSAFVALGVPQPAPDMTAAREAAAQAVPKLEAGSWQAGGDALQAINHLAASKDPADKKLAEKLAGLCAAAIEQGIQKLPVPPEQGQLLDHAEAFASSLLRHPTASNIRHAKTVVAAWEKTLPDDLRVRMLRLRLHVADKNRKEQITLSAALMREEALEQRDREYVWDVHASALLHRQPKPSGVEIDQAEAVVKPWLEQQPGHLRARLLLLEIHQKRQDWPAQYKLATELLAEENLTGADREWVHRRRLEGAAKTGRTHEFNQKDWDFMLERITGGQGLKRLWEEHGQLLLGIAFGVGWAWLFVVALITRSLRARPGFWMVLLWSTTILYASTVIMAPVALCVPFSLLGIVLLVFAITGKKAPLGYLVAPQTAAGPGRTRWPALVGWHVAAFLLIQAFTQGYGWAFERVMGRPLEAQLVARVLHTDTLPRLAGMVLAGGLFVPFLEEVVFRGLLQDWLGRLLPTGWCVALVSLLFGLVHGLEMAVPIAFIGLVLSLFRLRYRSLWPAVMLHALNNSAIIVALYLIPEKVL